MYGYAGFVKQVGIPGGSIITHPSKMPMNPRMKELNCAWPAGQRIRIGNDC